MQKVNLQVMKKYARPLVLLRDSEKERRKKTNHVSHRWIASKISEILGTEDDVVTELCFNLIEGPRYVRVLLLRR